jgi:hypothetical protein
MEGEEREGKKNEKEKGGGISQSTKEKLFAFSLRLLSVLIFLNSCMHGSVRTDHSPERFLPSILRLL